MSASDDFKKAQGKAKDLKQYQEYGKDAKDLYDGVRKGELGGAALNVGDRLTRGLIKKSIDTYNRFFGKDPYPAGRYAFEFDDQKVVGFVASLDGGHFK